MEYRRALVIDIETAVFDDTTLTLQPFLGSVKGGKSTNPLTYAQQVKDNKKKAIGKAALSPVCAQLLCLGITKVEQTGPEHMFLVQDKSVTNPEQWLLKRLSMEISEFAKRKFKYVTFNGRNFDFPFLMFRAAVHGIPLNLPISPYNGRDNHIDLFVHLNKISNMSMLYNGWQMIALKKWLEYFGLGTKLSIAAGEIDLKKCFEENRIAELEAYTMKDVNQTYELYKKFEEHFYADPTTHTANIPQDLPF